MGFCAFCDPIRRFDARHRELYIKWVSGMARRFTTPMIQLLSASFTSKVMDDGWIEGRKLIDTCFRMLKKTTLMMMVMTDTISGGL